MVTTTIRMRSDCASAMRSVLAPKRSPGIAISVAPPRHAGEECGGLVRTRIARKQQAANPSQRCHQHGRGYQQIPVAQYFVRVSYSLGGKFALLLNGGTMKLRSLAVAISVLALLGAGPVSGQQAWPSKPVHFIVPYAAGGFADIRARMIGVELAKTLGQPMVIESKPGAGGVLGTDAVAKAAPDGYTIGMGNLAPLAVNVSLMKKLPYDCQKDLLPVVLLKTSPLILPAGPGLPAKDVKELIALAKAKPGQLAFASSGIGGAHHLSGEMLRQMSGIDIIHVAYKGGAPAAADLLAGHVPMMFEMGYAALPSIKAGKIRALAVTSAKRLPILPEVPTMMEAGVQAFGGGH